ncbi:fimbrillin family protein [Bacteroides fragilis]|uniref:fimbrillin family protein n=1 Tax=Bacteroides fragilis TaxID=817 RepID=UPI00101C70BC|nr:fimbrillin family protein [Bacteroides fragilis]
MKHRQTIPGLALVAATILLGGCEKESDNTVDNVPVAARITSTIDDMATRAAGDAIGVSTSLMGGMVYTNVKYHTPTPGSGAFTVVNNPGEDNDIYFLNKEDVTFTAYYPYDGENGMDPGTNGIISKSITRDELTTENQAKFDYLFATATGSSASPNVKFQFKHCMSRIMLKQLHEKDRVSAELERTRLEKEVMEKVLKINLSETVESSVATNKPVTTEVECGQHVLRIDITYLQ